VTRRRRSSSEVRTLLIGSARELFAERGFAGTTTREIANRASVDETVLFRNFGSKEQLFDAAVVEPIDRFIEEYVDHWLSLPLAAGNSEEMLRQFVRSLYELAEGNRELLRASTSEHLVRSAERVLGRLERMAVENQSINGFDYNPFVAVRAAIVMVIATGVFSDALFGDDPAGRRDLVIEELTGILTSGLMRRRDGSAPL
jgi:AcrR family transcriptional regulator